MTGNNTQTQNENTTNLQYSDLKTAYQNGGFAKIQEMLLINDRLQLKDSDKEQTLALAIKDRKESSVSLLLKLGIDPEKAVVDDKSTKVSDYVWDPKQKNIFSLRAAFIKGITEFSGVNTSIALLKKHPALTKYEKTEQKKIGNLVRDNSVLPSVELSKSWFFATSKTAHHPSLALLKVAMLFLEDLPSLGNDELNESLNDLQLYFLDKPTTAYQYKEKAENFVELIDAIYTQDHNKILTALNEGSQKFAPSIHTVAATYYSPFAPSPEQASYCTRCEKLKSKWLELSFTAKLENAKP